MKASVIFCASRDHDLLRTYVRYTPERNGLHVVETDLRSVATDRHTPQIGGIVSTQFARPLGLSEYCELGSRGCTHIPRPCVPPVIALREEPPCHIQLIHSCSGLEFVVSPRMPGPGVTYVLYYSTQCTDT